MSQANEGPLAVVIDGGEQADTLTGTAAADTISGRGGSDVIRGGDGNDVLYGFSSADTLPGAGQIAATRVAAGLANPLFAASPPGDPDRLFIVEQNTGQIRILDLTTNTLLPTPFLDIPQEQLSTGGERGLLGLAFHPNFAVNGQFFVNLTNAAGDTEIWRYTRTTGSDVVNPASRTLVMTFDQPFANHNGGWTGFGPDGLLYIASGDGGSGGDPNNNAQNIDSLLGKVLRIDVNRDDFPADPARNYGIPGDNPFVGVAGADEVFMLGLRNPWRMSFDANGDLYVADVGQGLREEVNFVPAGTGAGLNFGWRIREGDLPFNGTDLGGLTEPVLVYPHGSGPMQGNSITGGYVYRGPGGAVGSYFFGDFVSGNLWTARIVDGAAVDFIRRNGQLAVDAGTVNQIASFAQDGRGRLYVVGLDGEVHRLTPSETAGDGSDRLYGGGGDDTVQGGAGDDILAGDAGNDILNGAFGRDVLLGGDGADVLRGGAGEANQLQGGIGDDRYVLDANDTLVELAGAGIDTVETSTLARFILPAQVEVLIHTGGGAFVGQGNGVANTLRGGTGRDTLVGLGGNDALEGGAGAANQLQGGLGDDRYVVSAADTIVELAGEGVDLVQTTLAAHTLAANVENLAFIGAGAFRGVGNASANVLTGGAGADVLAGRGGNDTLNGGAGSDIAELLGLMAEYQIANLGGGAWRVTDTVAGRDGVDVLNGVEQLRFANGQVLTLGAAAAPAAAAEGADWSLSPWDRDAPF